MFYFNTLLSYSLDYLLSQIPVIQLFWWSWRSCIQQLLICPWNNPVISNTLSSKKRRRNLLLISELKKRKYMIHHTLHIINFFGIDHFLSQMVNLKNHSTDFKEKSSSLYQGLNVFYVPLTYDICIGTLTQTCWMVRKQL